jgi:tetratricopeptide (TPR) repeat protein
MKIKKQPSMSRILGVTLAFLFIAPAIFSQNGGLDEVRNAYLANDLNKAKELIDAAAADDKQKKSYHTWYWRGAIYKELYKANEKGKVTHSENRIEAVKSYKTALADKSKVNADTMDGITKSLKFLASTLYNDAVVQLDTVNYAQAVENYNLYTEVMEFISPETDLNDQTIKFRMKLATIYVSLYDAHANKEQGTAFFEKAKEEYGKIIEMNKTHLSANYNLGILFYNKAVNIIQSMDYGIDLEALSQKEEECVTLFLQALPYMTTAYELDPKRKETLISLKGIYYSLNDQEKYDRYKKELEELK